MSDKPDTNNLLINEAPLQFLPSLAAILTGPNHALVVQQTHFLCRITEKAKNDSHFYQGRWWVYNSYEQWHSDHFPWLAPSTIKRLFLDMEKIGVILARPYMQGRAKTAKWYAVDKERLALVSAMFSDYKREGNKTPFLEWVQLNLGAYQNSTGTSIKMVRGSYQNEPSNKTETTTETTSRNKQSAAPAAAPVQPVLVESSPTANEPPPQEKIKQFPANPVRASRTTEPPSSAPPPATASAQHPFNRVYREVFQRFPDRAKMAILAKMPTDEQATAKWRTACEAWALNPFRPDNIKGILDWYYDSSLQVGRAAASGDPRQRYAKRGRDAPPPLPYRKPTQQEIDEALNAEILE